MGSFISFIRSINEKMGITLPSSIEQKNEIQTAQIFLERMNEYFFQTFKAIGKTSFQGEELQYFSEFHKFWEENHKEIINVKIDEIQAQKAASALSDAVKQYGNNLLYVKHSAHGLSKESIAKVRFFTANQDFREPPENQYEKYLVDPTRYDAITVEEDPAGFLKFLGMTRLSQTDKRLDYAKNSAKFLLANDIDQFQISEYYNGDAQKIRDALVNQPNIGYGQKKANMFIRDMYEMGVWSDLKNYDKIDVASDINTMKLALRTGILKTEIPLLSC